jgi:hypothetical protein
VYNQTNCRLAKYKIKDLLRKGFELNLEFASLSVLIAFATDDQAISFLHPQETSMDVTICLSDPASIHGVE